MSTTDITPAITYAASQTDWTRYAGPMVGLLGGIMLPAMFLWAIC